MAKNTTKIIAGLLLAGGVFFVVKYLLPKKDKPKPTPTPEPSPTPTPKPSSNVYPLQKGSKGATVKALQKLLLQLDKNNLPKYGADGDFGSETAKAVAKYLGHEFVNDQAEYDKLKKMYTSRILVLKENAGTGPSPLFL